MKLLESEKKIKGVLIRTGDYYIPLRKRVAKARNFNSDVLLSIHADAFKRRSANGSSVLHFPQKVLPLKLLDGLQQRKMMLTWLVA